MNQTSTPVTRFFQTFELHTTSNNIPALVAQFAETFLAAGPQGAKCVLASDFAPALPKRKQLFDKFGHQSTSLVSVHETALDNRFVLAKTRWQMNFTHNSGSDNFLVDSTFLLDTSAEEIKILLYLAHQDILQVLKDRGFQAV